MASGQRKAASKAPPALEAVAGVDLGPVRMEEAIASAQAAVEEVDLPGYAEFRGRKFRLGRTDTVVPVMDFAHAAAQGITTDDPEGPAAVRDMLEGAFLLAPSCGTCKACVDERYGDCPQRDPGDWPKFWRFARAVNATTEELMDVVQAAVEHATARPTSAPSGSSPPGRSTSRKSRGRSSSEELPAAFANLPEGDLIDVRSIAR